MKDTSASRPAPPVEEVAAHLRRAVGSLVRTTRAADRVPRVSSAVLELLDARGPMTTAELAANRGVRHQTMAATVKELTDADFLHAGPDPADARKKLLSLTEAGKDALDADRRQRTALLAAALEQALDEDELRLMAHALDLVDRLAVAVTQMTAPR